MGELEKTLAVGYLKKYSERLGNNVCNDDSLPNTDECWALYERMMAWNEHTTVEQWRKMSSETRPSTNEIYFMDYFIVAYIAHLLETS